MKQGESREPAGPGHDDRGQRSGAAMRIGLLSPWASRLGGGVFEAVVMQGRMIADQGNEPVLFALEDDHSAADRIRFPGEVRTCTVVGPRAIGFAPALARSLREADLAVLHLHGIWMYPSKAGADWAARTGRPYVISPHGMLDPWIVGRGRLKKRVARLGYERRSWRRAALFHALTAGEAEDIRRETGRDETEIVPNAVALAAEASHDATTKRPMLLALGRIHPKKNLSGLLAGWRASRAPGLGWELTIAGWGEAEHVAAFEAGLAALGDATIRFLGPAYGADKARLLGDARFLILPSFSEGLPLAILEAWAAGTPTIQSAGCNLPEGFRRGAALETGTSGAEIAAAIDRAVALAPGDYRAMTDSATALMADSFSPDAVGRRWAGLYRDLGAGRR